MSLGLAIGGEKLSLHHCAPFPHAATYQADGRLQLLRGNLCGPITSTTLVGNKYFILLVDDYNRFMWVIMLKSKDEVLHAFKKEKVGMELEADVMVKVFRTDRGDEFTSNTFNQYCDEQGIKRFLMAPYTLQHNGVIERRNQTILAMARSL